MHLIPTQSPACLPPSLSILNISPEQLTLQYVPLRKAHDLVLPIVNQCCQVKNKKEKGERHHGTHGVGDGGSDSQHVLGR